MRDGTPVLFRPLKPEDAALYPDCLSEITPDDLRLRYFAAMREVSPELIDKLVHYDPAHAMASIAIDEATGHMLGVVRLHNDPGDENAEFAIIVRSRLKGHGLGWLMMKHMIAYAKERTGSRPCAARCWRKTAPCCRCAASSASTPPTIPTNAASSW